MPISAYMPNQATGCMHVRMYLLIRKGQSAQKGPNWGENRIKRKTYDYTYESYSRLNLRCSVTDATESGKRFQLLTTLYAKLFRLLRVLPV